MSSINATTVKTEELMNLIMNLHTKLDTVITNTSKKTTTRKAKTETQDSETEEVVKATPKPRASRAKPKVEETTDEAAVKPAPKPRASRAKPKVEETSETSEEVPKKKTTSKPKASSPVIGSNPKVTQTFKVGLTDVDDDDETEEEG